MSKVFMYLMYFFSIFLVIGQSSPSKQEILNSFSQSNAIIRLTSETFKQFVVEQSNTYIMVILFSSFQFESQCEGCSLINPIFKQIASSYKSYNYNRPSGSTEEKLKPIFFAQIDYSKETHDIFAKLALNQIPSVYVSLNSFSQKGLSYNIDRSKLWEYDNSLDMSEDNILKFINSMTGRNVEIQYGIIVRLIPVVLPLTILVLILFLLRSIFKNLLNPKMWWMSGMFIYFLCIGGVVFDVLNNSPLGGFDKKTGNPLFISEDPKSQFIVEGFLMSFLISLAGIGLIIVNNAAQIENFWLMRLMGMTGLLMFGFISYKVNEIYKQKVEWYTPSFAPPLNYTRGSLFTGQGNSF